MEAQEGMEVELAAGLVGASSARKKDTARVSINLTPLVFII